MRLRFHLAILLLASLPCLAQAETPEKTTVCELLAHRETWNKKLVEVSGFASHGFEDSTFSSPDCESRFRGLWMSYGGTAQTGTISTVNENERTRPKPLEVEGIAIPLVDDATFQRFDDLLHTGPRTGSTVHATVVARFFAGQPQQWRGGALGGYGHLGCCSLFVIQQVLQIDTPADPTLDISDTPEQPNWKTMHFLSYPSGRNEALKAQHDAEAGTRAYAFTDPAHVALDAALRYSHTTDPAKVHLRSLSATPARTIYEATVDGSPTRYRLVLSRPYWLSLSAADPRQVAWVVLGAFSTDEPPRPG